MTFSLCLGTAVGMLSCLVSCSSLQRTVSEPPRVDGATFVGDASCVTCHANYTQVFAGTPHARVRIPGVEKNLEVGCESCHGPASKHVQNPHGADKFIVNPRKSEVVCLACHLQTQGEFRLAHHHPVLEGAMHCVQCHDPHGREIHQRPSGFTLSRVNDGCAECHREQAKPVIYEHEAMRDGCVTCHAPHGSVSAKMLVQRDNNLCLKCHAQVAGPVLPAGTVFIGKVDHTALLRAGTCWSAGCHTAVHGSNVSPRLAY